MNIRTAVVPLLISLALILILAACASAASLDPLEGFATPEEYIRHVYAPPMYANVKVYSKQAWDHGLIYMMSYQTPVNGQQVNMLGYLLFVRSDSGAGWKRTSGQGLSHTAAERDSAFVDEYIGIGGTNGETDPVIVYGKVLDSRVKGINVIYKEGPRMARIENGVFGAAAPDQTHVCALWVLGENGQVLERINLAKKYPEKLGFGSPEECALAETALMGMTPAVRP